MLTLPLTFLQRPAAATAPRPWLLVLMHGVGTVSYTHLTLPTICSV